MKLSKIVALGSIKSKTADLTGNKESMLALCARATELGKQILLFPELCLTGSDCQDLLFNVAFMQKCNQAVVDFASNVPKDLIVGFGSALADVNGCVFDAYIFVKDSRIQAVYCAKGFTRGPNEYRSRYFSCSKDRAVFMLDDRVIVESRNGFELGQVKVGVIFDKNYDRHTKGSALLILPSVRAYELGGIGQAQQELVELSAKTKALCAAPNLCGNESGSMILDGVCMLARKGKLLTCSTPCFFADSALVDAQSGIVPELNPYDEMLRAVALGLDDFMFNSKSRGFALSLSGGADSALCAAAVAISQICALTELGADAYLQRFKQQLGFEFDATKADPADPVGFVKKVIMPRLLLTVYQGSDNSSEITRNAAEQIAAGIGAQHHAWSISRVVKDYVDMYNTIVPGQPLSWEHDDLALQNIQARSRLPGIWLAANREGRLLIETSNLSEAAVGYCTMDGDTAGGLAPIGGIGKSVVRRINRHLEETGFAVNDNLCFKIPEMSYINAQAPTAELRPGGKQTDEGDLMPYTVLDFIRRSFAQEHQGPAVILQQLKDNPEFKDISHEDLARFVKRYFVLHSRSQWKRERFPTGFHIERDDSSPKGFYRFPIFTDDLKVLTADL